MKFGPVPVSDAEGAILAHSLMVEGGRLRKGTVLTSAHLDSLRKAGVEKVTVARLSEDDVGENDAALRLARALVGTSANLALTDPFTGRVNVVAAAPGVFQAEDGLIDAFNAVDPGITVATLPDKARVDAGMMVATIKIIPYAVPKAAVEAAVSLVNRPAMSLATVQIKHADLILTRADNLTDKALLKGEEIVRARLASLGISLSNSVTVPHTMEDVRDAVAASKAPLLLILGASATSDANDVCPAGVTAAGGSLIRFGMPVDPGNLLFLSDLSGKPVIGLPGCARSPALNGADWVLERIACGIEVGASDIAGMGVGGLLKEIPQRPQPRGLKRRGAELVDVVLLAAGSSRRMRGQDKLVQEIDGVPMLRRSAQVALASGARRVIVVLPPDKPARQDALRGLDLEVVIAEDARHGMASSLKAGLKAVDEAADGIVVMLADMPDVTSATLDALMDAFDPDEGHEICRAVSASGVPGHPVLFGRRFFEALGELEGDVGARAVVAASPDFVCDVPTAGDAALTDLDTPEQWAAYLSP